MKRKVLSSLVAFSAITLGAFALPSSAQAFGAGVYVGPVGLGVGVGPGYYYTGGGYWHYGPYYRYRPYYYPTRYYYYPNRCYNRCYQPVRYRCGSCWNSAD